MDAKYAPAIQRFGLWNMRLLNDLVKRPYLLNCLRECIAGLPNLISSIPKGADPCHSERIWLPAPLMLSTG